MKKENFIFRFTPNYIPTVRASETNQPKGKSSDVCRVGWASQNYTTYISFILLLAHNIEYRIKLRAASTMATEEINLDTSANNRFRKSPTQRQKWGEDQTVENTNWGDMFFDLFYVVS